MLKLSERNHLIIITDAPGQLCNQLWSYSPFIAYAKKINAKLMICGFDKYKDLFPNLHDEPIISFCAPRLRFLARLVNKKIPQRLLRMINFDRGGVALIKSWDHIKPEIGFSDKYYIKKLFRLPSYGKTDVKRIGVHIRHGDYITWRRGRFFFDFETMALKARELADRLFPDSEIEFAVASNVRAEEFCKINKRSIYYPNNSPLDDLGLLASCDVILGPPSTFSMWASFYGNVPLVFLLDANQEMLGELPPYIIAQNKFSDGSRLMLDSDG